MPDAYMQSSRMQRASMSQCVYISYPAVCILQRLLTSASGPCMAPWSAAYLNKVKNAKFAFKFVGYKNEVERRKMSEGECSTSQSAISHIAVAARGCMKYVLWTPCLDLGPLN